MNKLKIVAEKLGYGTIWQAPQGYPASPGEVFIVTGAYDPRETTRPFDPRTNPAQLVECIEWLIGNGWELYRDERYTDKVVYCCLGLGESENPVACSNTLADAVINAIAGEDDE